MSFLWGSNPQQTEFDQLVEKCTSDLLPANEPLDLPSSLHLSDLLRSSAIPPSNALKSLLPRLTHTNPNVQLLALQLLDVAIKNGGTPFLVQLAKPAAQGGAATDLELIASGRKSGGVNRDVGEKARKLLQEWAAAFKGSGKKELEGSELVEAFERLRREGIEFPALDKQASAAMVESLSAPDWLDSDYCTRCRTPFSTFNRKHHCRNCGQVFDQACSSQTAPLPHYGILDSVRVCDACHRKIKEGKGASVAKEVEEERRKQAKAVESSTAAEVAKADAAGSGSGHSRTKSRKEQEDEDLRKAIEASLADAAPSHLRDDLPPPKASGYNPSYSTSISDPKSSASATTKKEEEEDPDLAAAIAASLRDLAPPASAPYLARTASNASTANGGSEALTYSQLFPRSSTNLYDTSSSYPSSAPAPPSKKPFTLPNYDLSPPERSLLDHFSSLPPHAVDRRMYDDVRGTACLRLDRSVEDTQRRVAVLREMEWKLGEAARIYGAGLVERASFQPTLSRATSYAQPAAPIPPTPIHHAPLDPRYLPQTSSFLAGQPLPSYAVPSAAAAAPPPPQEAYAVASPAPPVPVVTQHAPPPQHYHPQQQQQPAGFYKPSHFPAVPSALPPTGLETLPKAPQGVPGGRRQEEEEEEEEEEPVKEAALIEF